MPKLDRLARKVEFDAWRARDLSDLELEYLYLDASRSQFDRRARPVPGDHRFVGKGRRPTAAVVGRFEL